MNERIAALTTRFGETSEVDPLVLMLCECGSPGCLTFIEISLSEYEAVRTGPDRWVVSSDHTDEPDALLARRNGYALIHDRLSTEALTPRKEPTSPETTNSFNR